MCGFVGFSISKHTNLGHRRLIIIDPKYGKQYMSCKYNKKSDVVALCSRPI